TQQNGEKSLALTLLSCVERSTQAAIESRSGPRSGLHQSLHRQLRPSRRPPGLGPGSEREREASVGGGGTGQGELRAAKRGMRHDGRGTQTQLGRGKLLRVSDQRQERGENRRRGTTQCRRRN